MAKLTEEQVLSWDDKKLESIIKQNAPVFGEGPLTAPEEKTAIYNPVVVSINQLKQKWEVKNRAALRTKAWLIPTLLVVPTLAVYFLTQPILKWAELTFVILIISALLYFWIGGKVNQWAKRKYERLINEGARFSSAAFESSIEQWARKRYDLPAGPITWGAYGSEFRLEGTDYAWKEQNPHQWVIVEVETGSEASLKASQQA